MRKVNLVGVAWLLYKKNIFLELRFDLLSTLTNHIRLRLFFHMHIFTKWTDCLRLTIGLLSDSSGLNQLIRRTDRCKHCPVGWGCSIHWLHLCRGVKTPNECPVYDSKQSDGEVPVMLGLWRIRSTPSLPLLPGPLYPGVEAPDRALSMG